MKHVIPLFSSYFGLNLSGKFFMSRNTYGFVIRDKKIINFMHDIGFPYDKKTTIVKAPSFVFNSRKNKICFLRGLFDTDGCITFEKKHKKFHYYPRIILSTSSKNLSYNICSILNDIKISYWLQVYKPKKEISLRYKIWIRGKTEVEKWFKIVGSKNPSELSRYFIWKRYGFCPPNLTYNQRKLILRNRLNPIDFYGSVA